MNSMQPTHLSHTQTHSHTHTLSQSNTELTAHALPDIRQLLTNQDHAIVIEAAKLLHELSKKDPSLQAIVANSSIVDLIIQTLTNVNNAEIQKALAGAVHNISSDRYSAICLHC